MTTLDDLLAELRRHGHICPMPQPWNALWQALPDIRRKGGGWEPPAPLILAAWSGTTDAEKRARFELHLRWADTHGVLADTVHRMSQWKPTDWLTEH